ncbi:MAG: trypsin-like serine protease [Planctomycetes bacterium]|nr:trypsin-like serine protease [Planctomycetota bacterium]
MQRYLVPVAAALTTLVLSTGEALAQSPATPPHVWVSSNVDSGYLHNLSNQPAVVFSERIRYDQTTWLQLQFAPDVSLPAGSFLRMTAAQDGAIQRHDARTLIDWSHYSARFNGNEVLIELVAGPGTRGNRVAVDQVARGLVLVPPESICGNIDMRVASNDPRQGRLFIGCTGWMAHYEIMLTAGHCMSAGGPDFIEFNVPLSTSTGQPVASHPDDQYPFSRIQFLDAGIGADWAVCRVLPNSNHGMLPTDRNNFQWYALGPVPGGAGSSVIRITGYGTTTAPAPANLNLAQKTGIGPLSVVGVDSLCYQTDSTGGNSGGPIILEQTGESIGIHTHGGCNTIIGCNSGTRIDRSDLAGVVRSVTYRAGAFQTFGQGCQGSGVSFNVCAGLNTTGGPLTQQTSPNEYAYEFDATSAVTMLGFRIYSSSSTGQTETVNAAIYAADIRGNPVTTPLVTTTVAIGASAGFYQATLATPLSLAAGRYFLAIDHTAGTTYVSNITSTTFGRAFRRPNASTTWSLSSLITSPSFQILCTGGTQGVTPAISGSGTPELGQTFRVVLSGGAPNTIATKFTGFSNMTWAAGSLPFNFGILGAPNCNLLVSTDAYFSVGTNAAGDASVPFLVPNIFTLVGQKLYHQWVIVDPSANNLGASFSNALETTLGG